MRTYGVERLGAFSDGVFAIVATLLVLDIKLPDPPLPDRELAHELVANVPAFFGWLVSFVVLARFWTVHHHVVDALARVSMSTIVWNFVFLMTISLLPFAASLVGTYEFHSAGPLVAFALGLGLSALTLGLFAHHVARAQHLRREAREDLERVWRHHSLVVPAVAVAASATALLHPAMALAVLTVESVAMFVMLRAPRAETAA
ncbi:MAG TPA: TMEM175 family protein [Actinomycetota bacterium]|nr:TMEM175 family protein [Actinomycetota bacterium]